MKDTIFNNAKFGDKFITRSGKIAIYQQYDGEYYWLLWEDTYDAVNSEGFYIDSDHINFHDIISKLIINNDKLEDLAHKYVTKIYGVDIDTDSKSHGIFENFITGFKTAANIIENIKPMPSEFNKLTDDNFWDLI